MGSSSCGWAWCRRWFGSTGPADQDVRGFGVQVDGGGPPGGADTGRWSCWALRSPTTASSGSAVGAGTAWAGAARAVDGVVVPGSASGLGLGASAAGSSAGPSVGVEVRALLPPVSVRRPAAGAAGRPALGGAGPVLPWALLGAKYTGVQQWMCEPVLGIEPATEDEESKPRPTQADKWIANLAAAGQFFEREGHLTVPRKHVEPMLSEDGGELRFRLGQGSTTSGAGPPRCPRSGWSSCPRSGCGGHRRCSCGTWVSLSGRGSGSQT
ncbi:hypothetical protein EES37_34775 [Streptomyces sp. ADI91-18]|nr:hypothetical protein EES37_34775 [Streptomyces sp. ADI91-18]